MSMKTLYVKHSLYRKTLYPVPAAKNPFFKKNKKSGIKKFFNHLNPFNWFNDFRDIPVTLEEFDCKRK